MIKYNYLVTGKRDKKRIRYLFEREVGTLSLAQIIGAVCYNDGHNISRILSSRNGIVF